ncbi:periplasmic heavy metal sensor [Radicibacter daui]|uniref:periplasmic heavy metal sensor n=1 Tax=Radicibacter daui TaxID=3064829 RepID=UPI004046F02B
MTRGRWAAVALGTSVLVNVFLVGFLTAWAMNGNFRRGPGPMGGPGMPMPMAMLGLSERAVTPEIFDQVKDIWKQNFDEARPLFQDMKAARQKVSAALRADPFDPAALKAALDELSASDTKIRASFQDGILETAGKVGPEGRELMARRAEHGPPGPPDMPGGPMDDRGPPPERPEGG